MINDLTNQFSSKQAITATAASTNVIDLGVSRDIGKGFKVPLLVQVNESFDALTSLTVTIQTDTDEAFGTAVNLTEQTIALADLVSGAQFGFQIVPTGTQRYLRLNYTVTGGAPTTGTITAGIVESLSQPW